MKSGPGESRFVVPAGWLFERIHPGEDDCTLSFRCPERPSKTSLSQSLLALRAVEYHGCVSQAYFKIYGRQLKGRLLRGVRRDLRLDVGSSVGYGFPVDFAVGYRFALFGCARNNPLEKGDPPVQRFPQVAPTDSCWTILRDRDGIARSAKWRRTRRTQPR
jgi:hypothetical protein